MDWPDLWAALALVLVIEGIIPFVSPSSYRDSMRQILESSDLNLRIIGFSSMLLGLLLLYFVR